MTRRFKIPNTYISDAIQSAIFISIPAISCLISIDFELSPSRARRCCLRSTDWLDTQAMSNLSDTCTMLVAEALQICHQPFRANVFLMRQEDGIRVLYVRLRYAEKNADHAYVDDVDLFGFIFHFCIKNLFVFSFLGYIGG